MSSPTKEGAELRRMVERLIIENRNSLNDPTTNEPYDVKGIADDVVALIADKQRQLVDRLEAELGEMEYRETEDMSLKSWTPEDYKAFGRNKLRVDVTALLNKIRKELDG